MFIRVTVKPRSHTSELLETAPGFFEARVKAAPYEGKANTELAELVAKHFRVAKSRVTITSGGTAKKKLIEISGV
jgi:uncharacterized protein YggU (UPF0235/DUF167 family)